MNFAAHFLVFLMFLAVSTSAAKADQKPIVFAAASLGKALDAVLSEYPEETRLSVAGSGTLARQVAQGAPADVVFLANTNWMEWLLNQGLVQRSNIRHPIGNTLVIVGPPDSAPLSDVTPQTLRARLGPAGRIAIGEHRSVPLGLYAKDWLEKKQLWSDLKPHLAETDNARAVLALVSRGEVPLAILYTSDLTSAPGAATPVWSIPASEQPDIRYTVAALTDAGAPIVDFLLQPEVRAKFEAFGFVGISK